MIFLPLGLFARIFRVPWVTIALVILIVVVSQKNYDAVDDFEKTLLRSEHFLNGMQKKMQMLAFLCVSESLLRPETCEVVKRESQNKILNLAQPMERIGRELPKSYDKASELAKIENNLMTNALIEKHEAKLLQTVAYQEWRTEHAALEQEMTLFFRERQLLSKGNLNPISVLKAQFIHAGYGHLIGNLLFFIFLSIFVELRLGAFLYSLVYLLAGTAGLMAHVLTLPDATLPLLGASANISGVAGAFTVFFWRKRVKILGTLFFVYNRIFALPVYFFFPVLMFAGDLAGSLASHGGGVAHFAHMVGFLTGAGLAYLIQKSAQLPAPFAFEQELREFNLANKGPRTKRGSHYLKILRINPENTVVHRKILADFPAHSRWDQLSDEQRKYVGLELPVFLDLQKKEIDQVLSLVSIMDVTWPLQAIFKSVSGKELRNFYEVFTAQNHPQASLILIRALFHRYPRLHSDPDWGSQYHQLLEKNGVKNEQQSA
jgi:membrane associated rhomboid family serine protease